MARHAFRRFGVSRSAWLRAFWTVMFVAHAPAVLATWQTAGDGAPSVARFAVMLASQVLFLLKILNVRWLRLPITQRAGLAIVCAVVLLHAGVIHRASASDVDDPRAWAAVTVVAVVTGGAALSFSVRQHDRIRPQQARRRSRYALSRVLSHACEILLPARFLLMERACPIDRAPPH